MWSVWGDFEILAVWLDSTWFNLTKTKHIKLHIQILSGIHGKTMRVSKVEWGGLCAAPCVSRTFSSGFTIFYINARLYIYIHTIGLLTSCYLMNRDRGGDGHAHPQFSEMSNLLLTLFPTFSFTLFPTFGYKSMLTNGDQESWVTHPLPILNFLKSPISSLNCSHPSAINLKAP